MNTLQSRFSTKAVFTLFLLISLSGCANKYLADYKVADLSTFSDHTIALMQQSDLVLYEEKLVLARPYYDYNSDESKALVSKLDIIDGYAKATTLYSLEIATLSNRQTTEKEKVMALAKFLDTLKDNFVNSSQVTGEEWDDTIAKIQQQENLLDALKSSQFLVNRMNETIGLLLSDINRDVLTAIEGIQQRVDLDFSKVLKFHDQIINEKDLILVALQEMYSEQKFTAETWNALKNNLWVSSSSIKANTRLSQAQFNEMERILSKRIDILNGFNDQVKGDLAEYAAIHKEIDALHPQLIEGLDAVKFKFTLWTTAHQKMASGRVEPAEWFNVSDLGSIVLDLGKKYLKK